MQRSGLIQNGTLVNSVLKHTKGHKNIEHIYKAVGTRDVDHIKPALVRCSSIVCMCYRCVGMTLLGCTISISGKNWGLLGGSFGGRGLGGGVNSGGGSASFDNSFHDSCEHKHKE